jgi:hypothetical protein
MSNITITTRDGVDHNMSVEHYTRWLCLVEALDVIHRAAERNNIDLDKRYDWVKPLAIQKYMDERFHSMLHDVKVEEHLYVDVRDNKQKLQLFVSPLIDHDDQVTEAVHDNEDL